MNYRTVVELENTMSIRELYEWHEHYNEEPFLADRIEIQLATVCTMIAGFGKSKPKHSDYMIRKTVRKSVKLEKAKNDEVLINIFFPNGKESKK